MLTKINTYVLLLGILTICLAKVPEVTLSNFDGSLFFVQVYEDGCQNCNE
jgi:hypothetical protein